MFRLARFRSRRGALLSDQELATLWHPAIASVQAPQMARTDYRRLEPPVGVRLRCNDVCQVVSGVMTPFLFLSFVGVDDSVRKSFGLIRSDGASLACSEFGLLNREGMARAAALTRVSEADTLTASAAVTTRLSGLVSCLWPAALFLRSCWSWDLPTCG